MQATAQSAPDGLVGLIERVQTMRKLPTPHMRRTLRQEAGLTMNDVARVVGVSRQAVANWERGDRTPRGHQLEAYVGVLEALKQAAA